MARFIALTEKGNDWTTLFNLDHVLKVDPYIIKNDPASLLTFINNGTVVVKENYETVAGMVEAISA